MDDDPWMDAFVLFAFVMLFCVVYFLFHPMQVVLWLTVGG